MSIRGLAALVLAALAGTPTATAGPPSVATQWVTLGTNSGPLTRPGRGQPANLLIADNQHILVDAGDGASEALLRHGLWLDDVKTVFISHLHFDHTGGLFAFLGRRFQVRSRSDLTIYGPTGTRRTVEGLIAAMKPMADANDQFALLDKASPGEKVTVVEMADGSTVQIGSVRVTAALNTHYALSDEKGERNLSLSYRFDAPGRSVAYTADTGPSSKVEALAKGVDLLVSEILDAEASLAEIDNKGRVNFALKLIVKRVMRGHFTMQHLSPEDAGQLAQRAGAKALLLTHIGSLRSLEAARQRIAMFYSGPITFAEDMRAY